MTSATLANPFRAAWSLLRAFFGICLIAILTIFIVGAASWDLFQFLLGCAIFFTALCMARPLSGRTLIREKEAFLLAVLVIWVFLMVSEAVFSHHQSTASAAQGHIDPSAFFQAVSWILSLFALVLITYSRPAYLGRLFAGPLKWASIFAIVAVISCPLSLKPMYSAALAFKLCVIVLALCAVGEAIENETGIFRLFAGLFVGTLVVMTMELMTPLLNIEHFNGRLPMIGLSGTSGVLLLLCLLFFFLKKKLFFFLLICAGYSVAVMMLAGNKGGMVASFVSLMMFFLFLKRPALAVVASIGFAVALILAIAFTPLGKVLESYTEQGNASSLTGRTNLWSAAWPNIKEHPILGKGYRSSRFLSEEVPGAFQEAGNMHNSFLEVTYNNGLAGLIPIVVMNVIIVNNLSRVILRRPTAQMRYYAAAAFALYIQLLVWGLVAVTFGGAPDNRFMTFFAILVISMYLRGQSDQKYWNKVYGDVSS
jgi:O-antigen ligase